MLGSSVSSIYERTQQCGAGKGISLAQFEHSRWSCVAPRSQNFVGVRVKATTRRAKLGRSRRATKLERSLCPGPSSVLSPIFPPDGISSMARSCRYCYEHDPFCSWRTLLRFARCCLFLSQEALPVRDGTQTERRPAVPELRNSVPIDASLYTRALLIRLTWGVVTLSRREADRSLAFVWAGSSGSRIDGGHHVVAP